MAKLVTIKNESNPDNEDAVAKFAYFEGKPTPSELKLAYEEARCNEEIDDLPQVSKPTPDVVSKLAGLWRYYLGQAV